MLQKITKWFSPPQFPDDEDKTRSALLLNVVLNTFLLAMPVLFVSTLLLAATPRFERTLVILAVAWLTIFGTRQLMLAGRVVAAGQVTVLILFTATTLALYNLGTIRAPATAFYILAIVTAGLTINRRAIVWMAGLSTTAIMALLIGERNKLLPTPTFTVTFAQGITFTVVFGIIAILLFLAIKSIDEALARVRQELIERQRAETKLRASEERLEILHKIGHAITELRDLESVLEIILQQVLQVLPLDTLFITLYDPETQTTSFPLFYEGGKRWDEPNSTLRPGSNISRVIQTGESILRLVTAEELEYSQKHPQILLGDRSQVSASFIYVPLLNKGTVIGLISVQSYALNVYTETNLRLLEGVAPQAAIAIENARLYANLQNELTERLRIEAERELLIKKLETNNAELERFTYTVSHDLRSPLVTIKGFLGMLAKDIADGRHDRIEKDMGRIANATDKMDALLSDLLELSRIGRIVNPPVEVDLGKLTQDALELSDARIRNKHVTILVSPDLPIVYGDRLRLREVLENLITNAAKYMGNQPDPSIEIGIRNEKNEQIVFVKDNGIGIEERYHTRIFNLFEKLNPTVEGTGIGLALVKRIIETHGGRVWVESEGLGKGSTFCFTIPDNRRVDG